MQEHYRQKAREGAAFSTGRQKPLHPAPRRAKTGFVDPSPSQPRVTFSSPRHLPDPATLPGRVVVLDIAFAADGSKCCKFTIV